MAEKVMELRKGGSVEVALALQSSTGIEFDLETLVSVLKFTKDGNLVFPFLMPVTAKTADYTVLQSDNGTLFTNKGAAGSVNFTLPVTPYTGTTYEFQACVLAQNLVITSGTADKMVVYNDIAADSITFSTSARIAGAAVKVTYDGDLWLCRASTWNIGDDGATTNKATIVTA